MTEHYCKGKQIQCFTLPSKVFLIKKEHLTLYLRKAAHNEVLPMHTFQIYLLHHDLELRIGLYDFI
jgi:hypothetical protein